MMLGALLKNQRIRYWFICFDKHIIIFADEFKLITTVFSVRKTTASFLLIFHDLLCKD